MSSGIKHAFEPDENNEGPSILDLTSAISNEIDDERNEWIERLVKESDKLGKKLREKSIKYGPQEKIIGFIFDELLKDKKLVIKNGADAWKFHLLMEVVAKSIRTLNLYCNPELDTDNEDRLPDALGDGAGYNLILRSLLLHNKEKK
jgi:hypothetical protein